MTILGLDTSRWSDAPSTPKTIDWNVAKSKGVEFMFTKATESNYWKDPVFDLLYKNAKEAKLLRGAYHFFSSKESITDQVDYFWGIIKNDPGELPPTLDLEDPYPTTKPLARGATLYSQVSVFLERLQNLCGKVPIIYTSPNIIRYYLTNEYASKLIKYPLWIAQYIDYTTKYVKYVNPSPWLSWTFWQYSDRTEATQYGFNEAKTVDANIFNGTIEDLNKFCGVVENGGGSGETQYTYEQKLNKLWDAHPELH